MYQKYLSSHLFRWLHTGLVICLVAAVVLSVLPTGLAQADADSNPQPMGGDGSRSPDVYLEVNYAHDWVSGLYDSGYPVSVEVRESDNTTVKASMATTTGPIPWWDGASGFDTDYADSWVPDRPDIQPGDYVHASVDLGGGLFDDAQVQVGTIEGDVDITTDSIAGTINVPWLPQLVPVDVICHPWGAPGEVDPKFTTVLPDGSDEFSCSWNPATEWDVEPNQNIAISYMDPTGHRIYNVFVGYTNELIMRIHYDHDWIEGNYEPGHDIHLTVYDSGMSEKAHITVPTGPIDDWGGQSGFATYLEGMAWVPEQPDIQPGDFVHGEVDGGSEFAADVEVGTITGTPDVALDSISGTVAADWLIPDPGIVDVACSIWEPDGREVYTSVVPDGVGPYVCVFDGDNTYDIVPGTNLMVSYFEPDGHQLIGDFTPPAPYLLIEKWFTGESIGEWDNPVFGVRYQNQGSLAAEGVTITDTLVGMTYLSDTSGYSTAAVPGDTEVIWDVGTVDPGDWIYFEVYADVTALVDGFISNTAEISTSNLFDMGDPSEKISTWEGTVAANDTHLNVGKYPWTGNPAPGEDFIYQINVCNNGSTSSSPVTMTDTLPDATTFASWSSEDAGWEYGTHSDHTLELTHTSISSWSCSEVYILVTLDPLAQPGDELINHVEIAAANDMETEDNTADVQHNVGEPYMDLGIWHDWHGGSLVPGGQYCYGINFRNEGNVGVSGPIAVTATLPVETSFAGWDGWGAAGGIADPDDSVANELTWEVSDLMAGAQGTIQVCLDILPGTATGTVLEHLADIEDAGEENTENNHDEFVEYVRVSGPNLRVQKWGDWSGEEEGQYAQYYIQVENIGDEIVEDVILTDYYPAGMELDGGLNVEYEGNWEWEDDNPADNAFSVYLERLEPGWVVGMNFNTYVRGDVTLEPLMPFSNVVEVPLPGDIEPADNSYEHVLIFIGPRPYLRIEKWLQGESVGEGGIAAFGVSYQNQGELPAENVTITDTLVGMTYLGDNSGFPATVAPGDQEVSWDVGTVEPGDWINFEVYADVTAPVDGDISNTVWITTTTPYDEGDESEKISTWEGTVVPNDTHLNVGKWPWTENPAPGEEFVYTVNVCNDGSTGSSPVTMMDTLPDATTFVDWWSGDLSWVFVSQIDQTLELEHWGMPSWSCSEVYIVASVAGEALPEDELINLVEIAAANDMETEDNTAEYHHQVGEPYMDLGIWHDWHGGSLVPGGQYCYGVTFRNEGNVAVGGPIAVTATHPAGTSFAGWDSWGAAGGIADPGIVGNVLTWAVGDMIAGAQGTIQVCLDIDPGTAPDTVLAHLADIEIEAGEEYLENNTSTLEEMVYGQGPNLRIRKEGGVHGHGDGHNAWYRLNVENIGDVTVNEVVITDYYPDGMELDGDVNVNFWEGWYRDLYADHFTVTLDKLEPGWNMQIDYNAVIPGTDPIEPGLIYENTAQVMPMAGDVNPEDNETNYMMATGPDMYVDKKLDSGEFMPGEQVTFLLEFGNKHHDNSWWWGMDGNAILTDILPDGMSFVSAYLHKCLEGEWCEVLPDIDGQTLTWDLYPLGGNSWNEILLTVLISNEIEETNPLINTVAISSDSALDVDPFPENNYSEYVPESGDFYIYLPLIMR